MAAHTLIVRVATCLDFHPSRLWLPERHRFPPSDFSPAGLVECRHDHAHALSNSTCRCVSRSSSVLNAVSCSVLTWLGSVAASPVSAQCRYQPVRQTHAPVNLRLKRLLALVRQGCDELIVLRVGS